MILRDIILEDFGLYRGRVEIPLAPRSHGDRNAPVVLIGGRNGAGKTTVLEAVRLALHGKRALGPSVSRAAYEAYLRGRLHRADGKVSNASSVSLGFQYGEQGETHHYRVTRRWSAHDARVVDTLEIERDYAPFTSVPREEWDSFLQALVPVGIAQLFFFDGEKIQEIADGEDPDGEIAEAIRGLLGIELVGRLRGDLSLYLARHRRAQDGSLADDLEHASREVQFAEQEVQCCAENRAEALTLRESKARHAEALHNRFVAEGGSVALERQRFEEEQQRLRRQGEQLAQELRKLVNGTGPFLLAPRLLQRLEAELQNAQDLDRLAAAQSLEAKLSSWRSKTSPKGLPPEQVAELRALLDAWATEGPEGSSAVLRWLGGQGRGLTAIATVAATRDPARELSEAMESNAAALHQTERALQRINSDVTDSLLIDLKAAERASGAAQEALRQREALLHEARIALATAQREQKKLIALQEQAAANQDRADMAVRIASVLRTYEKRLLAQKVAHLSHEFVRCFHRLARKPKLIASVEIDPENFRLTLHDVTGAEVPRSALSAGEKQIFAIALLWALGRTSGRTLPVIVDTPLARLDSIHRRHLVDRYFPEASAQVIVLSTDAEIDAPLRQLLEPSLSHAVQLEYDEAEKRTLVVEGYFENAPEVRHAVQ